MIAITLEKNSTNCKWYFLGNTEGLQKQAIGLQSDSRKIKTGDIFAPIVGERVDGHDFIQKAFEAGAVCCFCEKDCDIKQGQYGISVKSICKGNVGFSRIYYKRVVHPCCSSNRKCRKNNNKRYDCLCIRAKNIMF